MPVMGTNGQSQNPVEVKSAYVKMLFLVNGTLGEDNKSYVGTPVMMRSIRNSPTPVPVFDTALYYTFTKFNTAYRPRHFEWVFTSQDGKIDDAMQIFPFDPIINASGDGTERDEKLQKKKIDPKKTDNVVTVAHWYNAFREGAEWAGARADDDTSEIRLTVDFTSVITALGKENLLFKDKPRGFIVDGLDKSKTPVAAAEYSNGRVFSVSGRDLSKDDVLRLEWKLHWENLGEWMGMYHNKKFTPSKKDTGYEPPI